MCGNFGFLGKRIASDDKALLPARVVEVFQQMGRETEIRGEQAGGGLVLAGDKDDRVLIVGKKILNQKRGNLTQSLEAAFAAARRQAVFEGIKPLASVVMGVWHYRYGTSSAPAIVETHWHEWMPARDATVWQFENGKWFCSTRNVNHRITHNGDFDAWRIFGKQIDNAQLGLWLERVLHTPNDTTGDSPKISGMMDLLIAQGMWDASVRLAYQLEVAESLEEAFDRQEPAKNAPNTAPSQQVLSEWAEIFEKAWQQHIDAKLLSNQVEDLSDFEHQVCQELSQNISIARWSDRKRIAFVKAAVDAFLHNDLYRATQLFMSGAQGSFGLVTVSTLSPENLVLSSQGQPIAIGFNLPEEYTVYASEAAAVNAVLADRPKSYRLDLDQTAGEIALVGTNKIAVYSMKTDRELLESELEKRWMPVHGNSHIQRPQTETEDPVKSDIQEIPQVLAAIAASWRYPASFNYQSAEYLADILIEKVKAFEKKRQKMFKTGLVGELGELQAVDFLIVGIENSLWLGERFAQDLKIVFPLLNIKALSANQVLSQLQHDAQSLHLGQDSIVLAISQSGQTFPTLQATNAFEKLYQNGAIGGVFILTGELNSLMGAVIGQSYAPGAAFSRRIFINGSGRRSTEPSTVTVAAAQQTLTELLFHLALGIRQAFPDSSPLGMTLMPESLSILQRIKADFLDRSVASIAGITASGAAIKSKENQQLVSIGRKWALHVTETPLAWGIHALYVLIVFGWAIPFGYTIPVTQTVVRLILLAVGLPSNLLLLTLLNPAFILADIGIAIFGPWLWTLGLRCFQGRELLARIGKRTLVIGDVPWVHQLLESYVSKLFSLSYGIASLEVHGANPQDHLLHRFGHRLARGTLVFIGLPDGHRSRKLKQDRDAAIMTGKQADGVRNLGVGAEIVAVGHDREIEDKGFNEAIVLEPKTNSCKAEKLPTDQQVAIEELRESRFNSFEPLLASYVIFWALARKVASFPFLRYQHWKSQSRTRIATTAAPVSGINLDLTDGKSTPPTQAVSAPTYHQPLLLLVAPNTQETDAPTHINVPSIGTLNQPAFARSQSNYQEFLYPFPALNAGVINRLNEPAFARSQNNSKEFLYPIPVLDAGVADKNVGVGVFWGIKPQQKIQGSAGCLPHNNLELGTLVPKFNLRTRKREN